MTPIDNTSGKYTADGFTWAALLPAFVRIPDAFEQGLAVEEAEYGGLRYQRISRAFDARQVELRRAGPPVARMWAQAATETPSSPTGT